MFFYNYDKYDLFSPWKKKVTARLIDATVGATSVEPTIVS